MTNRPLDDDAPLARIDAMISALAATRDDDDSDAILMIRDAMINDPATPNELRALAADYDYRAIDLIPILDAILSLSTDDLTAFRLSLSICPLHAIDYAICFDDDNPNCAQIRAIHPSHDS